MQRGLNRRREAHHAIRHPVNIITLFSKIVNEFHGKVKKTTKIGAKLRMGQIASPPHREQASASEGQYHAELTENHASWILGWLVFGWRSGARRFGLKTTDRLAEPMSGRRGMGA